jgi:hypothetical protein
MQTDEPEPIDHIESSQHQSYLTTPMPEIQPQPVDEVKVVETVYKLDWVEVENRVRLIVSELQE